jgi:hypothetical protein
MEEEDMDYGNGAIIDSIFGESKVDKVISKYFEVSKKEIVEGRERVAKKKLGRIADVKKQMGEVMEVQDDFELLTWDLVSNPSNPDSWMKNGVLNESRTTYLDPYARTNSIITEILCAKATCPIF